jgi:hypothetical protein
VSHGRDYKADMIDRQRENLAKYFYDLSKGVVLIATVGGVVSGQVTFPSVILGLITAGIFLIVGFWIDGNESKSV